MTDSDTTTVLLPVDLLQDDLVELNDAHHLQRHLKTWWMADSCFSTWNKDGSLFSTTTLAFHDSSLPTSTLSFSPNHHQIWTPPDQRRVSYSNPTRPHHYAKRDQSRRYSSTHFVPNQQLLDDINTYFSATSAPSFYLVQFKLNRTELCYALQTVVVGDWVIIDADRGQDLGQVVQILPSAPPPHQNTKRLYRLATKDEIACLGSQSLDEEQALVACQAKMHQHNLPMQIVHAEYQWDRRKLTFYFVADQRVDFRDANNLMTSSQVMDLCKEG